jgi:hypothetical protein
MDLPFMMQCPHCEIQLHSRGFLNRHVRTIHAPEKFILNLL